MPGGGGPPVCTSVVNCLGREKKHANSITFRAVPSRQFAPSSVDFQPTSFLPVMPRPAKQPSRPSRGRTWSLYFASEVDVPADSDAAELRDSLLASVGKYLDATRLLDEHGCTPEAVLAAEHSLHLKFNAVAMPPSGHEGLRAPLAHTGEAAPSLILDAIGHLRELPKGAATRLMSPVELAAGWAKRSW